jgi:hypothetical protein
VTLPAIVELSTESAFGGGATVPRITTVLAIGWRTTGAQVTGAAGGSGSGGSPEDFEHAATATTAIRKRATSRSCHPGPGMTINAALSRP